MTRYSTSSSSIDITGDNDDLLIEMLLFLPARSVVRFKLVCERWRSLISDASFGRLHTLNHPRRRAAAHHSFILCNADSKFFICHPAVSRLIPFTFGFPFVFVLQSCNGLFLLRYSSTEHGRQTYCIFNPATMQYRDLSPMPGGRIRGYSLMFDPSLSLHYRVLFFLVGKDIIICYVYDSESPEWKVCGELPKQDTYRFGISFKGGVYFLKARSSWSRRFIPNRGIHRIPSPPMIYSPGVHRNYAYQSNGALLSLFYGMDSKVLHVHETTEVENGWSRRYRVYLNPSLATFGANDHSKIDLLGMIRGEKEEDSLLLLYLPGKIVTYWFCDDVSELLVDLGTQPEILQFGFKNTYQFVETLAPV